MRVTTHMVLLVLLGVWLSDAMAASLDRLIHDATSGVPQTRLRAIKALGDSGDPRALRPILAALQDKDTKIRTHAIAALRALARTLDGIYRVLAQWIDTLITSLEVTTPEPEVERTGHQQRT